MANEVVNSHSVSSTSLYTLTAALFRMSTSSIITSLCHISADFKITSTEQILVHLLAPWYSPCLVALLLFNESTPEEALETGSTKISLFAPEQLKAGLHYGSSSE